MNSHEFRGFEWIIFKVEVFDVSCRKSATRG